MCGEHVTIECRDTRIIGSSPHVRGTRVSCSCGSRVRGIIPACAGNTLRYSRMTWSLWDHPRMCGEHIDPLNPNTSNWGSSPHVRGTRPFAGRPDARRGIIPACAGNTEASDRRIVHVRDHPRMCGEHISVACKTHAGAGSSPHVRGTLAHYSASVPENGIIPACAGNTRRSMTSPLPWRDHPRMCGEHLFLLDLRVYGLGSSPHVRGTLLSLSSSIRTPGIIPACAGNTACTRGRVPLDGDHPRMCGEHFPLQRGASLAGGSSPHVRGTPTYTKSDIDGKGIIPACAGNT